MNQVEFRKECACCGAVINREFYEMADNYTGKRIIIVKDLCCHFRNGKVVKLNPYYVGPVRIC